MRIFKWILFALFAIIALLSLIVVYMMYSNLSFIDYPYLLSFLIFSVSAIFVFRYKIK